MYRLDTMTTGGANAQDSLELDNYPVFTVCAGLLFRFQYPILHTGGTAVPPTIVELIAAAIGSLTVRYGKPATVVPYATVPGPELRNVHRFVTRVECPNNLAGIITSSTVAQFDLFLPFAVEELVDGRIRCPGWSLMRTMEIDLVEGPALATLDFSRGTGNVLIDVDVLVYPSAVDRWGPVLSYYRANQAALRSNGPDGVHLSAWEISAAQDATAIELFSLAYDQEQQALGVPPYVAGDKYLLNWDDGLSPITDEVTMGFSPDEGQSSSDLPSGHAVYTQATQYVPLVQLRGLYWPPLASAEVVQALDAASAEHAGPLLAALPAIAEVMPERTARTLPMELHPPQSAAFVTAQGLLVPQKGAEAHVTIPDAMQARAAAAVQLGGVSGTTTQSAEQSTQLAKITRRVPGLAQATHAASQDGTRGIGLNPSKFAEALKTVQGTKGTAAVTSLFKSIKL